MLDIEFLNEKATKIKTSIKKVSEILNLGKEEFIKRPIYPDRAQYYMLFAYDELDKISCYILKKVANISKKENCLIDLANEKIFSEKVNRVLIDFYNFRKTLFENSFEYPPDKLYPLAKNIVDTLSITFIKELANLVKELKAKEPKLKYPVNLKKLNEHAKNIKSTVKKLKTFSKYSYEDFEKSPLFIDRTRYYLVVLIDLALWVCKHLSRKMGIKARKDCFIGLLEKDVLDRDVAYFLQSLADLRNNLANPEEKIDTKLLYRALTEKLDYFEKFIKSIAKAIFS